MDREKAADLLDNLIGMVEDNHGADYDTALKMGIEALSTSGDGPEPVDDTISRQAAIDALQKEIDKGIPPFDDVMGSIRCGVRLARNIVEDLPSAQPEIIRCKDCVDYQTSWVPETAPDRHYCATMDSFMPEDGFCNYAETKKGGKNESNY